MDRSNQYEVLMEQREAVLSNSDLNVLKNSYQFVFIKGIFGDVLPDSLDHYFLDQMNFLDDNQIDNISLESSTGFGTQKTPKNNVVPIENAIKQINESQPDKKVIVVTHSKGGLDTLEMLISGNPEVKQKVAGWISLNAPFSGTPLANWATSSIFSRLIVNSLLKDFFKGQQLTINTLRTDVCQQYLIDHSNAIDALSHSIGILNFACHITFWDTSIFSMQSILINTFNRQKNDGVVPQESGLLKVNGEPCCPFVRTKHLDHVASVLHLIPESASTKSKREKQFAVLLKLWLENHLV